MRRDNQWTVKAAPSGRRCAVLSRRGYCSSHVKAAVLMHQVGAAAFEPQTFAVVTVSFLNREASPAAAVCRAETSAQTPLCSRRPRLHRPTRNRQDVGTIPSRPRFKTPRPPHSTRCAAVASPQQSPSRSAFISVAHSPLGDHDASRRNLHVHRSQAAEQNL